MRHEDAAQHFNPNRELSNSFWKKFHMSSATAGRSSGYGPAVQEVLKIAANQLRLSPIRKSVRESGRQMNKSQLREVVASARAWVYYRVSAQTQSDSFEPNAPKDGLA